MQIIVNPNKAKVERLRAALAENGGYCPCAAVHNKDTKCMCKAFRESTEAGLCHCGLYLRREDGNAD